MDRTDELADIASQLRRLERSELKTWLKRGELLQRARDLLGNDFPKWLRATKQPRSTSYHALAAYVNFGSHADPGRFTKEAMAVLERSAEACAEAKQLATAGEKITARRAKELVARYLGQQVSVCEGTTRKVSNQAQTFYTPSARISVEMIDGTAPTKNDIIAALLDVQRQLREKYAA